MKSLRNALAMIALTTALCGAEETLPRKNTVAIHPFISFLVSGANLHWERAFGEGLWSMEIPLVIGYSPYNGSRLGGGLGLRRYLEPGAAGWYAAPKVEVIDWNDYAEGDTQSPIGTRNVWLLTTARAGYKWELGRLSLDGSLGGGYLKDFHVRGGYNVIDYFQPSWTPVVSLTAGWTF